MSEKNQHLKDILFAIRKAFTAIQTKINPRLLLANPTTTATYGQLGEIAYYSSKWYGKTVATGTDTNWTALN